MIGAVLKKETCKSCRNCCWYTDIDVWDAPGFTKGELERARVFAANPVFEDRGLFFFQMEKHEGIYRCPLLCETGCLLGAEKPFKCAIWPFYVVHTEDHMALAISNECPSVYRLSNVELVDRLGAVIAQIGRIVRDEPALIEPFRSHFRIVAVLD